MPRIRRLARARHRLRATEVAELTTCRTKRIAIGSGPCFDRASSHAMSYYEDLSPWSEGGDARLLAVGWLSSKHPYPTGDVPGDFFRKLVELLHDPWQPAVTLGRHPCPFCRFTGGPATLTLDGSTAMMGTTLLFVPAPEAVYVAPSLIAHTIDAHAYAPPDPFQSAVLACPEMRSMPYLRALRSHGLKRIQTS
jgi:hypothetical protein